MNLGLRIKKFRLALGLTQNELAQKAKISRSYLADVENGRYNPSLNTLENIAEALNVPTDKLIGKSASSIIEARLEELGMPLSELSEKSHVPLTFLLNLDNIVPDQEIDGGEQCFTYISSIAWVLGIPGSKLRIAFARQEAPTNDGPMESAAESFATPITKSESEIYPVGKLVKVPIIGTVAAGPNGLAFEDYQGEEWVDASLVNGGNYFYLRVKGDSMINEGILPGDLALVRETPEVRYGALAVVLVNNEEGRIKRVYKNSDSIILQSSNPKYQPEIFKNESMQNVKIIGEVKSTVRKY
jgi:repressor LexA